MKTTLKHQDILRDKMNRTRRTGGTGSRQRKTGGISLDSRQIQLQTMIWPGLILMIVFVYVPLYYIIIAFKDFDLTQGVFGSPWVGLHYFKEFLSKTKFYEVLRNTLAINLLQQIFAFPAPIILALLLNELQNRKFKRLTQTISYLPHFVSWVIYAGIIIRILHPDGVINDLLMTTGLIKERVFFLGKKEYFWFIAVFSGIAKSVGWSSIIYLAAISGIDQQLYDSAYVDGANRFQRMWYITLPSISPTIIILLILNISYLLNTGFDQIWMLQNPLNLEMSDTIEIYVYKTGLEYFRFSYATAVGLSQSAVALLLLVTANTISKRVSGKGLY